MKKFLMIIALFYMFSLSSCFFEPLQVTYKKEVTLSTVSVAFQAGVSGKLLLGDQRPLELSKGSKVVLEIANLEKQQKRSFNYTFIYKQKRFCFFGKERLKEHKGVITVSRI